MTLEIERKFLVEGTEWKNYSSVYYSQAYLNSDKNRTVRIRIAGKQAFLTIKSLTKGSIREEFEYSIPIEDAQQMLKLCEQPIIEKNRRIIVFSNKQWEVDEFLGINEGLVVAEIELKSEDETFEFPTWIGEEVTSNAKYFNSNLVKNPYSNW